MIVHRALALRLEIALFVLPIALLWERGAEGLSGRGVLSAVGVALLAIFLFASLDTAFFSAGRARRYSPSTRTLEFSLHGAQLVRLTSGFALALAALVLVVVEWRLGGYLLICAAAIAVIYRRRPSGSAWSPLPPLAGPLFTAVLLAIPPALSAMPAWAASMQPEQLSDGSPTAGSTPAAATAAAPLMPAATVAATGLGALLLLGFLLLCSVRDETADTFDGVRSLAAKRGRASAIGIGALMMIGMLSLASIGVARHWWPWGIAAGVSVLAVVTSWLLAARTDHAAAKLWSVAQVAIAWSLFLAEGV